MRGFAGLCGVLALAGCGLFSEDAAPLPGERIAVRQIAQDARVAPDLARELAELGPPLAVTDWPQSNIVSARAPGHIAGPSGLSPAWRTDIGTGSGSSGRITSPPVVAGGRVFAMDAAANVTAVDAGSGRVVWRRSVVPEGQGSRDGFGGGLAVEDGRLLVSTGFGEALALGVADGQILWRQRLGAPVRAAPAVADGIMVVVTRDNSGAALDTVTGSLLWALPAATGAAPGVVRAASPAIAGPIAVLPFTSGELLAVRTVSGRVVWADALSGGRRGLARALIADVSGDPVVSGVAVFAANHSGQMVAIDSRTGQRGWIRTIASTNPSWVVGPTLFVLDDDARLMRLAAATGETLWATDLPAYSDTRRRTAIAYGGPVVAGGRVYVTSSNGELLVFDARSGEQVEAVPLPGGSSLGPVIAGGTLYVLADNGVLHAFR